MDLTEYVQGECHEMCPKQEMRLRERQRLLHVLEMVPGTERLKFPQADPDRTVKAFSRSAAGRIVNSKSLRSPEALLKTVSYLLFDVVIMDNMPWYKIYDFITDRLMAVRQDMVIQNISRAESIALLQPIVRFHAYAAYKLCHEPIANFDPALNTNHLQECLKRLLKLYDECDRFPLKEQSYSLNFITEHRPECEALYIALNLGNEEALRRTLSIPAKYKNSIVEQTYQISMQRRCGNFVRTCKLMKSLPVIVGALISSHLPEIRRKALQVMASAYNSKNVRFSVYDLRNILLYRSTDEVIDDCYYYGLDVDVDGVIFVKHCFEVNKKTVTPRYESFVDEQLHQQNIATLLL